MRAKGENITMKTHIILNTQSGNQILLPIHSMIVKQSMRFDTGCEVWYSHEPYENSPTSVCETLDEIIALINEAQNDPR